jgi:SAM-dependent methyltransferase
MAIANVEMAAAWDGSEGEHWAEHAERYESIGPGFWEALMARLPIGETDDVLDIGCGTGRSTRDAARMATGGTVLGIDLSGPMLASARATTAEEGLSNVRFEQADAQVYPFPSAAFDVAVSTFGGMFFSDPIAAFANIAGALRPAGRLGLLAWRPLAENEWLCAIRGALAAGRELPAPPTGAPGPFGLADPRHVAEVLGTAGFTDVTIEPVDAPMRFGSDVDDAYGFLRTQGIVRGLTEGLDDATRAAALEELRRIVERHATGDGVVFRGSAWVATARQG